MLQPTFSVLDSLQSLLEQQLVVSFNSPPSTLVAGRGDTWQWRGLTASNCPQSTTARPKWGQSASWLIIGFLNLRQVGPVLLPYQIHQKFPWINTWAKHWLDTKEQRVTAESGLVLSRCLDHNCFSVCGVCFVFLNPPQSWSRTRQSGNVMTPNISHTHNLITFLYFIRRKWKELDLLFNLHSLLRKKQFEKNIPLIDFEFLLYNFS